MGMQIIKQPDGNYAVFDSITDTFCSLGSTKEAIIEFFVRLAQHRAEKDTKQMFEEMEAGRDPYYGSGMSWAEAARTHMQHKGNVWDDEFGAFAEQVIKKNKKVKREKPVRGDQ